MNLSSLPSCWPSLSPVEREEAREILALLETKPPGPVERAAGERLVELLDAATARDRRFWSLRDPTVPEILSVPKGITCTPLLT